MNLDRLTDRHLDGSIIELFVDQHCVTIFIRHQRARPNIASEEPLYLLIYVNLFLLAPADGFAVAGAVFLRACVGLDESVVGPNAGLSVHAPILVIADRLNAWIGFCRCELTLPRECRTDVRTVPVEPYGVS